MSIPAFLDWDYGNKLQCLNSLVSQINALAGTSIAPVNVGGQSAGFLPALNSIITQVNTLKGKSIPLFTDYDDVEWLQQVNKYIALLHASGAPF